MDLFLVASTPLLRLGIHTCTLSLLKTSLFCVFLFFQDGGQSQGSVRCGLQSRGTPCPPPQSQAFCLLLVFLLADTRLRLAEGVRPVEPLEESEHSQWWQTQQGQ